MAVQAGRDYGLAYQIRTALRGAGPSRAVALVTRRAVFILPWVSIGGSGSTMIRTTQTLGGLPPGDAVRQLLGDPSMTVERLEAEVGRWTSELQGGFAKPLDTFKRIKIRTGFFTRSVIFSSKASGYEAGMPLGNAVGFRPAKEEIGAFDALFNGDPRRV